MYVEFVADLGVGGKKISRCGVDGVVCLGKLSCGFLLANSETLRMILFG